MSTFTLRKRIQSFAHAARGARTLLATQPNAWIHAFCTVTVVAAGVAAAVSAPEWALLTFAIALVWLAEALNTAVEFLADEITEERRERIGKAKDVAACGVLLSALASIVIGLIVFWPHFFRVG